jgi:hypothetical protein
MLPDLSDIPGHRRKMRLIDTDGAEGVRIFCGCGRNARLELAPLIAKYGPEITFDHVARLARCSACGSRKDLDARPVYTATMGAGDKQYST